MISIKTSKLEIDEINNIVVLLFKLYRTIYINNLSNKMDISELQSFLKTI